MTEPLPAQPVDPPTLSMTFRINDGPFAGQEGDKVQSRVIRERLMKEAERNIAIRVTQSDDKDAYTVAGRGELQLAILIENMRREGFELTVSRPKVVYKEDPATGQRLEPIEEVIIDVDDAHTGVIVSTLSERKGELVEMRPSGGGRTRMVFYVPTRGLLGYQSELLSDTRGTAVMNRIFHAYAPFKGEIPGRRTGVLVSNGVGEATAYALFYLQDRGPAMIAPQARVYEGMIVGEHTRDNDLVVNITQGKKLSNVRAAGKDENLILTPPMHDAGEGDVLHRRRRAGRGDAELDPAAQAVARPQRAQEAGARRARPSARRAWRDASANGRCLPPPYQGGEDGSPRRWPWWPPVTCSRRREFLPTTGRRDKGAKQCAPPSPLARRCDADARVRGGARLAARRRRPSFCHGPRRHRQIDAAQSLRAATRRGGGARADGARRRQRRRADDPLVLRPAAAPHPPRGYPPQPQRRGDAAPQIPRRRRGLDGRADLMWAIDQALRVNRGAHASPSAACGSSCSATSTSFPRSCRRPRSPRHLESEFGGPFFFSLSSLREARVRRCSS